jgi:sulfur-oxidizing protein SoxY
VAAVSIVPAAPFSVPRRRWLARAAALASVLGAAGLLPARAQSAWNKAAFEAHSLADVVKALGAARPTESRDVVLTAPDIAENGAEVPLAVACALPGLQRIAVVIDKNPNALAAVFTLSDAVEPRVDLRVKMAQSSDVFAVALLADGRVLYARRDVKVTIGGCGQ